MFKHTLRLFRHLSDNLPPLVPPQLVDNIQRSIKEFGSSDDHTLGQLERSMIDHGFQVWPFYRAHKDFLEDTINRMGDHFLEPLLPEVIRNKYIDLKHFGGNWYDFYSGRAAQYFEPEERYEIAKALVEVRNALREYTAREIHGTGKKKYLARVKKYNLILVEIRKELDQLKDLANREDHPDLAAQITAKIQDIEHSFAHLGKELQYHEVFNAVEYFMGRKEELKRLRGIDAPKVLDIFTE